MPNEGTATPFRIVIIAELLPRPEFALARAAPAIPMPITRETFDEVMQRFGPSLSIELPANGGPRKTVEVTFSKMRAFRPEWIAQNILDLQPEPVAPLHAPAHASKSLLDQLLDDHEESAAGMSPQELRAPPAHSMIESVVTHPEVRRLEAAWRGVKFVVDSYPSDAPVRVEVLHAAPDAVAQALELLRTLPSTDGAPIGLIVVDAHLGATARDRNALVAWAQAGEALRAPVVTNGTPEILGFDSLEAFGRTSRGLARSDDPRAAAFRTVAANEASRWLVVALNGVMARPRHSKENAREGVQVLETSDLFFGAAFGVAALVAGSVHRTGAPFAHTGASRGALTNLPVRVVRHGESEQALSLEAEVRADVAAEAAKAGIAVLCPVANRDVAVLPSAPVVFRGPTTESGSSLEASLTLGDQLFTAVAVSAVFAIADAIPAHTEPRAARESAMLLLAEALTFEGARAVCEVGIGGAPLSLNVTVRPGPILGVALREISFSAPLHLGEVVAE